MAQYHTMQRGSNHTGDKEKGHKIIFYSFFILSDIKTFLIMKRHTIILLICNIRIHHECEGGIEKYTRISPIGTTRLAK